MQKIGAAVGKLQNMIEDANHSEEDKVAKVGSLFEHTVDLQNEEASRR